jgi:DHA1 family tetracycline resistance protein-like MFS transporter
MRRMTTSADPGSGTDTATLIPLLLVNFINVLGFSIVIPFLVFLVEDFGGGPFIYGLVASIYPFFQLIGAPVLGRWSDVYGRKRILLLSQFGTFLSWVIFLVALLVPIVSLVEVESAVFGAFAITVPLLILGIARALDGITGGNVSVANAYLADITTEKDRSQNFGRMAISSNLGFIIGPALAGVLAATVYAELLPVSAALVISLVAVVVIVVLLPEQQQCALTPGGGGFTIRKLFGMEVRECSSAAEGGKLALARILHLPHISFMLVLYFVIFLGFNIYYTSFVVFAADGLGWTPADIGIYFSVLSVAMVIVQGPVLSRASRRFSESTLIIAGSMILGTNFVLLLTEQIPFIYLAAILFAIGNGLMWPSYLSLLSKVAGTDRQGAVQGFAGSAGGLASIIGLISGGLLYAGIGSSTFLVTALVIYGAGLLSFRLISVEKAVGVRSED